MKKSLALLVLVLVLVRAVGLAAEPAVVDAVINIYGPKLKIFSDHKGSKSLGEIKRADVKFPAVIRSNTSPYGLIRVRFQFKLGNRKPVTGWVPRRAVRVAKKVKIDVPDCAPPSPQVATVTRGVRGLGQGCK